jgi:hypothetical protein
VGAAPVVALDGAVQDVKQLPAADDQEMVQALSAFSDGVGVGRLDRRADDFGADCTPEVIEGPGELAVTVTYQESDGGGLLIKRGGKVAGLLGDPGAGGVGGDARKVHASGAQAGAGTARTAVAGTPCPR